MTDYTMLISDEAMISFLNRSLTGAAVIVVVLLLRLILNRMPKRYLCLLWLVPLFRLLVPFSLPAPFSLLPVNAEPLMEISIPQGTVMAFHSGLEQVDDLVTGALLLNTMPKPAVSADPVQIYLYIAKMIWVSGMALFLAVNLYRYFRLKRRLRDSVPAAVASKIPDGENPTMSSAGERTSAPAADSAKVRFSDRISMPMVAGILKPCVFLPSTFSGADRSEEREFVTAHEQAHIRRRDHLTKTAAFAALAVHWFNPLVWLMFALLCRDMEMACDESVLRRIGEDGKRDYSLALLRFEERQSSLLIPLAFGESHTKARIKNILNYRKPPFWIGVAALAILLLAAFTLLTDPEPPAAFSVGIIGGADGPTSIFLAGKIAGDGSEQVPDEEFILTVENVSEFTVYSTSQKISCRIETAEDGSTSAVVTETAPFSEEEFSELKQSSDYTAGADIVGELMADLDREYGDSGSRLLCMPVPIPELDSEAYRFLAVDEKPVEDGEPGENAGAGENGETGENGEAEEEVKLGEYAGTDHEIWFGIWYRRSPNFQGSRIQRGPSLR